MKAVQVTYNEFAKDGAREGVRAAIVQTMVRIHGEAVVNAPVDLGQLKNSLMWRKGWTSDVFNFPKEGGFNEAGGKQATRKLDDTVSGDEGIVGTNVEHGVYQEFGTRYMPAQPFLRVAADAVKGATASEIADKWGREAMEREFKRRKVKKS